MIMDPSSRDRGVAGTKQSMYRGSLIKEGSTVFVSRKAVSKKEDDVVWISISRAR